MPKATTTTIARSARRHNPLADDLVAGAGLLRQKAPKRKSRDAEDDEDEARFVDSKASKKILQLGRELADEDREVAATAKASYDAFAYDSRFDQDAAADDEDAPAGGDDGWLDEDEGGDMEEVEVDADDLETFNKFLPSAIEEDPLLKHGWDQVPSGPSAEDEQPRNLADIILAKIAAHESGMDRRAGAVAPPDDYELPPKVIEVYEQIGMIMARYKSGKLPKPLKILPTVAHWEEILEVTRPDLWTVNAVQEVTRVFISAKAIVGQRFLEMVLLDRVRDEIHETKKLSVHLFSALKKSLYKPGAFFKGFLFPLVSSGCTLREAHIISGVLVRVSIPVLHSAAALKGLTDIVAEQTSAGAQAGAATTFIKVLLDKRYALPYQVLDNLVFFFLRFRAADPAAVKEEEALAGNAGKEHPSLSLPVVWHQALLVFAQRYKNEITEDQRELLLDLLLSHGHPTIGQEIRRELLAGRGRGVALEPQGPAFDGDDTMLIDS